MYNVRIHLTGPAAKPMDHAWMKSLVSDTSLNLFGQALPSRPPRWKMVESLQDGAAQQSPKTNLSGVRVHKPRPLQAGTAQQNPEVVKSLTAQQTKTQTPQKVESLPAKQPKMDHRVDHRVDDLRAGAAQQPPQVLLDYAHKGCPVNMGAPWTKEMMEAAIEKGPHVSALDDEAMEQLQQEVQAKAEIGQCTIVKWDDIKANPPEQLKISPIAIIPHKSRLFRAILDLSFGIKLQNGEQVPLVNKSSVKNSTT